MSNRPCALAHEAPAAAAPMATARANTPRAVPLVARRWAADVPPERLALNWPDPAEVESLAAGVELAAGAGAGVALAAGAEATSGAGEAATGALKDGAAEKLDDEFVPEKLGDDDDDGLDDVSDDGDVAVLPEELVLSLELLSVVTPSTVGRSKATWNGAAFAAGFTITEADSVLPAMSWWMSAVHEPSPCWARSTLPALQVSAGAWAAAPPLAGDHVSAAAHTCMVASLSIWLGASTSLRVALLAPPPMSSLRAATLTPLGSLLTATPPSGTVGGVTELVHQPTALTVTSACAGSATPPTSRTVAVPATTDAATLLNFISLPQPLVPAFGASGVDDPGSG